MAVTNNKVNPILTDDDRTNKSVFDIASKMNDTNQNLYDLSTTVDGVSAALTKTVSEWDKNTSYPLNQIVTYKGVLYRSLSDNNSKNEPSIISTYWYYLDGSQIPRADYYASSSASTIPASGFYLNFINKFEDVYNSVSTTGNVFTFVAPLDGVYEISGHYELGGTTARTYGYSVINGSLYTRISEGISFSLLNGSVRMSVGDQLKIQIYYVSGTPLTSWNLAHSVNNVVVEWIGR